MESPKVLIKDSSTIHSRLFSNVLFLFLVLSLCLFPAIEGSCVGVTECDCEVPPGGGLPLINCRSKQLTSIPTFTGSSTQYSELTLAGNNIKTIPENAFNGLYIYRLDLSGNPIQTIASRAFYGIQAILQELFISFNPSADFPTLAMSGLTNLQVLKVTGYGKSTLPLDALMKMTSLTDLSFLSGNLRNLSSENFRGQTASLGKLSLNGNRFDQVPTTALAPLLSLLTLDLGSNLLTQLVANAFAGSLSLQSIIFDGNSLQGNINSNAFADLSSSLKSLSFVSCRLMDQSLDALRPLRQLTTFNALQNNIASIPSDLFSQMKSLRTLVLDSNRISSINAATFMNVSRTLKILNLRSNPLSNLQPDAFSTVPFLEELALDGIASLKLDKDTFSQQRHSLKTLTLNQAGVGDTIWPAIAPLNYLETLQLSSASLISVPDFSFQYNGRLRTIDLSSNGISSVSQRTVAGLEDSLVSVNLNQNKLTTLDHCSFFQFQYFDFTKLGLTGNQLNCDCNLLWLYRKVKSSSNQLVFSSLRWTCSSGRLFVQLNESDFGCSPTGYTESSCVSIIITTTPDLSNNPIILTINNQSSTTITLNWMIDPSISSDFKGITLICTSFRDNSEQTFQLTDAAGEYTLTGLIPTTEYQVCVVVDAGPNWNKVPKKCVTVQTMAQPKSSQGSDELTKQTIAGIAIGSAIGAILLIVIIVFAVIQCNRRSKKKAEAKAKELRRQSSKQTAAGFASAAGKQQQQQPPEMPRIGHGSRRYTKKQEKLPVSSRSTAEPNLDVKELPMNVEAFSREERDKILTLLTAVRSNKNVTTPLHSIDNASQNSRYVTRPYRSEQLNRAYVNDEIQQQDHFDEDSNYAMEPLDSVV